MADMSLAGFIGHLAGFQARLHASQWKAFNRVGRMVQSEAVREVGTYQDGAAPFVAWAELADSTKADRVALGFTENDPGLRTGGMRDSYQYKAEHDGVTIGSDDDKAVWFELGTDKQPPRSVLGMAVVHKEKQIEHALGAAVVSALVGHDVAGGSLPITGP